VQVVSLRRLIALKAAVQPPRPKDLLDLAELCTLEKQNRG